MTVRPMFRKDVRTHAQKRSSKATKPVRGIASALVIATINLNYIIPIIDEI